MTANMPAIRAIWRARSTANNSSNAKSLSHEMANLSKGSRNMKAKPFAEAKDQERTWRHGSEEELFTVAGGQIKVSTNVAVESTMKTREGEGLPAQYYKSNSQRAGRVLPE